MKNAKKAISVTLALLLCLSLSVFAAAEDSITITSVYENIDWNTVNVYKTALHTHTNASDGDPTLRESIGRHVEAGFDIVATTDHGTVNYSWSSNSENKLIHGALSLVGKSEGDLDYLGESGVFADGTAYEMKTENGDDYLTLEDGSTVLRLPYGIENNAVSANAHVNSWFTDYHDNTLTTYWDAVHAIDAMGGICVINHPGEYTKARYELHSENAYDESDPVYKYYVDKFASLIDRYDGCIGIDVNSKGDNRTRFDRILWDDLLMRFAANGENVFAICSSDAHALDVIDTGFTLILAGEKTSAAAEDALRNGTFFGASHCLGNYDELVDIAAALKEYYGETELYNNIAAAADAMEKRVEDIENGTLDADEDISITYRVLDEDGYPVYDTFPSVNSITVDDSENTITIDTSDALIIRWISNGKLIATTKADGGAFDLDDCAGEIGDYIRAEIFGEGGILYTQAFLINAEENAGSSKINGFFVDAGFIDCLFAIFKNWFDIIARFFAAL